MEFRASAGKPGQAEIVLSVPGGATPRSIDLSGERATVGRLPDVNDIALHPDPELLVTRVGHCTLERAGARWYIVDGGSVNGTFLRRGGVLERLSERTALHDGDVVCVVASVGAPAREASSSSRTTQMRTRRRHGRS